MMRRGIAILLGGLGIVAACVGLPAAPAQAAVTVSIEDPLEGTPFVPDLGRTSLSLGEQSMLVAETLIVARPPAGWGGCVPLPTGICLPAQMSVSWYFDDGPDGSPAQYGADAKVVATPAQETTTWQSLRWDRSDQHWVAGAVPAGATDISGVRWSILASELGLAPNATVSVRVVARFRATGANGEVVETRDESGPFALPLGGLAPAPAPAAALAPASPSRPDATEVQGTRVSAACRAARLRVTRLERRIAAARKVARGRGAAARRRTARDKLRRLRPQRAKARTHERHACARTSQPHSR
jgi:hypothetical protein